MGAFKHLRTIFLAHYTLCIGWLSAQSLAVTLRTLATTYDRPLGLYAFTTLSFPPSAYLPKVPEKPDLLWSLCSDASSGSAQHRSTADGSSRAAWDLLHLQHRARGGTLFLRTQGETQLHATTAAEGCSKAKSSRQWSKPRGSDLHAVCNASSGRWFREGNSPAFNSASGLSNYPLCRSENYLALRHPFSPYWGPHASPRGDDAQCSLASHERKLYPRDIHAFKEALSRLDERFLEIAKETASPTAKNEEILQSLSMLWRQRHLEHRQEEAQQQSLERRASAPLYTAGDENILGRRGSSAFRARAYKTAFEIIHGSRIPIRSIAEVLLLLREGGLILRGEELNIIKRGAFRSAVLQKIHSVLSHGVAGLIKKSRSVVREGALGDLSRLPGVSRRTAALLFDNFFVDSAQALRGLLAHAQRSETSRGPDFDSRVSLPSRVADVAEPSEVSPTPDVAGIAELFPTVLSRACIIHADAFGAAMDATEFDEWQQQLLLVLRCLRDTHELTPSLPLDFPADKGNACSRPFAPPEFQALPVSLLPGWTEENVLPPALDHLVCCGGHGARPDQINWVQRQWDKVSEAYKMMRQKLHCSVVDALKQRGLVTEIICDNARTNTTHAAGRLPWRQETYRLIIIQAVPPRAFPFATLAARCCASVYRPLQNRIRKRWGYSLTPRGLTVSLAKKRSTAASVEDQVGASSSLSQTPKAVAGDVSDSEGPILESCTHSPTLAEQALWAFDEQGVLRLLQEPLSMQERVGKILTGP